MTTSSSCSVGAFQRCGDVRDDSRDPDAGTHTSQYNGHGEWMREVIAGDGRTYSRDVIGRVTTLQSVDGVSEWVYDLPPFGARVDIDGNPTTGPPSDIRDGFTGHRHDDELGLIDMRGRIFDTKTSRFLALLLGPTVGGNGYGILATGEFVEVPLIGISSSEARILGQTFIEMLDELRGSTAP